MLTREYQLFRELLDKWRSDEDVAYSRSQRSGTPEGVNYESGRSDVYGHCADELEKLLDQTDEG